MDHAKATVEAATAEKAKLVTEIEELKAENQSFEQQYEEVNLFASRSETLTGGQFIRKSSRRIKTGDQEEESREHR